VALPRCMKLLLAGKEASRATLGPTEWKFCSTPNTRLRCPFCKKYRWLPHPMPCAAGRVQVAAHDSAARALDAWWSTHFHQELL